MTIKRILVPTDFGVASAMALSYARELASATGASLYLLNVVDDIAARFAEYPYAHVGDVQTAMELEARRELDELIKGQDRRTPEMHTAVLTSTLPASAIVGYAADEHIDLIVMGTHGRAPVVRVFLGSVADRVVRTAPCPVLTVQGPKSERGHTEDREHTAPPMAV